MINALAGAAVYESQIPVEKCLGCKGIVVEIKAAS